MAWSENREPGCRGHVQKRRSVRHVAWKPVGGRERYSAFRRELEEEHVVGAGREIVGPLRRDSRGERGLDRERRCPGDDDAGERCEQKLFVVAGHFRTPRVDLIPWV